MNLFQAFVLGAVQGLTEFLPISSSGHLALFQNWFSVQEPTLVFDVFLHAASLIAVFLFFWKDIQKLQWRDWWLLGIGTIPAVLVGVFFKDSIETAWATTILLGVQFIVNAGVNVGIHFLLKKPRAEETEITEKRALTIGAFQALALVPAISRSGMTLLGGLDQGLEKDRAFRFTFLLAIPAILGANAFQVLGLFTGEATNSFAWPVFLVGGVATLITSLWSLRLLQQLITKSRFLLFGAYCFVLGVAILVTQLIR